MTRLVRNRVAATTGLATLATVSLGLAFAPAALAATELPPLQGSGTAVIGEIYELTGTGCEAAVESNPAIVYVDVVAAADADDPAAEPVLSVAGEVEAGSWTAVLTFLPAATPGEYVAFAACEPYDGGDAEDGSDWLIYPNFSFTLEADPVVTPPSTPTTEAPAPSAVRGEAANTPGVAARTTTATTKTAVPGQKVVRVYEGFQPFEVVTLTMHSTPQVLGSFTADAAGVLTVEFTLPAGTPVGAHTLVLEGPTTYFQEGFEVTGAPATASSDSLAYTGASVGLPLAVGAGLLVAGGGALVATRRRAGASQA